MATVNKVDLSLGEFWEPFFVGWPQALSLAQPGGKCQRASRKMPLGIRICGHRERVTSDS